MQALHKRFRFHVWMWFVLVIFAASPCATSLYAQEGGDEAEAAAGAEGGEGGESKPAAPQSQLMWVVHTSGWIGLVLLLISFYFVALVAQLFIELREPVVAPPDLMDDCNALLTKRDYNGVYKRAKESASELGDLIAAGLAAYSGGYGEAREAVERQGELAIVQMERRISMLAVIGSLGPMIGLLGTLKGMIASFSVIATGTQTMKASEVAGGISEALLITFEGVALSVPAIYFFAVFKNRVSTLTVQTINKADDFIRRFHSTVQSKPTSSSAAASS